MQTRQAQVVTQTSTPIVPYRNRVKKIDPVNDPRVSEKIYHYDKEIAISTTQRDDLILSFTVPTNVIRFEWELDLYRNTTTGTATGTWILSKQESGNLPTAINVNDSSSTYLPEQEVIASGSWSLTGRNTHQFKGYTDTHRLFKGGNDTTGNNMDRLYLSLVNSSGTNTVFARGIFALRYTNLS